MHKNASLDNCMDYRLLKGKAQHVIKSTARNYWQDYCSTLNKSTKLATVWRMAKKMNGVNSEQKIKNVVVNGVALESNEEKAEAFAKSFSDISSNENYSSSFLSHKDDIERNHKNLFDNTPTSANTEKNSKSKRTVCTARTKKISARY